MAYKIIRFYHNAGIRLRTIKTVSSLIAAQLHCKNPESSSRTCMGKTGKDRTRKVGQWFDGYEEVK